MCLFKNVSLVFPLNVQSSGESGRVVLKQHKATWSLPVCLQEADPISVRIQTFQCGFQNNILSSVSSTQHHVTTSGGGNV